MATADSLLTALRQTGMRVTRPRRAICVVLAAELETHMSAVDLQERAQKELGGPIDLSTVYRTIESLQGQGLVHHVHLGSGASIVHVTEDEHHHHLYCDVCGRTVDVPRRHLAPLRRLLEANGYLPDSVHFAIVSRCASHSPAWGPPTAT